MEPILYWYPVVYSNGDASEDRLVVCESGKISPIQLKKEPYEVAIEAGGASFHLVFGHKSEGMFLCIPDRYTGCELSELSNRDSNMNFLLKTGLLDYEDTTAIVWALYSINGLLRFIH